MLIIIEQKENYFYLIVIINLFLEDVLLRFMCKRCFIIGLYCCMFLIYCVCFFGVFIDVLLGFMVFSKYFIVVMFSFCVCKELYNYLLNYIMQLFLVLYIYVL